MKSSRLFCCLFIAVLLGFVSQTKSDTNSTAHSSVDFVEQVDSTIIKVYSARNGQAQYHAYAVSWKGQEVVVSPSKSDPVRKEGDTIPVYVYCIRQTDGSEDLAFLPSKRRVIPFRRKDTVQPSAPANPPPSGR